MKKFLIKSSVVGLSALAFSTAHAQSSTSAAINFTGRLTNATCTVVLADRERTIDFNSVPATTDGFDNLNAGGVATAAYTRSVDINLENCSAPNQNNQPSGVTVSVSGPDVVTATGRLRTNHASLNIQLLEGQNDTPWNLANASQRIPLVAGNNVLRFKARYYLASAVTTATPLGNATASAVFNMNYQ